MAVTWVRRQLPIIIIIVFGFTGWAMYFLYADHFLCPQYDYINRELVCSGGKVLEKTSYMEVRNEVVRYIESEKEDGTITSAAFYFRDLENGPVSGYGEYDHFAPASLLKLPLAFVFMLAVDDEEALLDKPIRFVGDAETDIQREAPSESALPETDYPIRELLRMMLSYSDNASYLALESFITATPQRTELRANVFQELGLIDPKDREESTVTVRGYASLFRILYNSAYLSPESSEQMLAWLAASDYEKGLRAGVPEQTVVAHKFGERLLEDGTKQLHDCGIVYFPDNPYLLCIMTRGQDWKALEETISTISRMIYTEVNSRRL